MKHLKKIAYLLVIVAFTISCEKETVLETEIQNKDLENYKLDLIETGYKVEIPSGYLENKKENNIILGREEISQLVFFNNEIEFDNLNCGSLNFEDFEETILPNGGDARFTGPLNEFTNNSYISPGDIVSGVEFQSTEEITTDLAIFGLPISWIPYDSKYLGPNYFNEPLILNFSNGTFNIGMNTIIYGNSSNSNFQIEIYNGENLLESTLVDATYSVGFWGVQSEILITKIIILPNILWVGIDNLSFGTCNNPDIDDDGVLNDDDPYPNSNLSETINIGENYLDIENVFTAEGTTMMDQIDALIAEINAQYDGENWDELHRDFTRGIAKITYYWRKDRLISRGERSDISSAAWSANIPYFNEPG